MKPVILHPEAEAEFEHGAEYYEANRTRYGEVFRGEVAEAFMQIANTPGVSRRTREVRSGGGLSSDLALPCTSLNATTRFMSSPSRTNAGKRITGRTDSTTCDDSQVDLPSPQAPTRLLKTPLAENLNQDRPTA